MNRKSLVISFALCCMLILGSSTLVAAKKPPNEPIVEILVTDLESATGAGSTIGPDGALYVTESEVGRISRVDPQTGDVTTFASGLPEPLPGFPVGGVYDVAFVGQTAYALVTIVGSDLGGVDVVGIYRVDGADSFTVVADIGAFSAANPPDTDFFIPTGVQYALESYRGAFLVTDGHHNRVLRVTLDGEITELIAFDNIVPTGLALKGNSNNVYMAQAGPTPHAPEDGKIVAFKANSKSPIASDVASGAPLAVDVEFGRGRKLYVLSQGEWDRVGEGSPAMEDTGALMKVNKDGTLTVIVDELDRPTSVEFIGNTAYVVTLGGEVLKIDNVSGPPYGVGH